MERRVSLAGANSLRESESARIVSCTPAGNELAESINLHHLPIQPSDTSGSDSDTLSLAGAALTSR